MQVYNHMLLADIVYKKGKVANLSSFNGKNSLVFSLNLKPKICFYIEFHTKKDIF